MIAESVYPISYADLRENGGPYKLTRDAEAVIAIPSYDVRAKATQGNARPVYVISEDEVSWRGGPFKVIQSQNARVVKFVPGGLGAPHPEGRQNYQAQPVYVAGGTSDYYLKLLRTFGARVIYYLPMWEQIGGMAYDQSRNRFHSPTFGAFSMQPGIGDGYSAYFFNGATNYIQPPLGFRQKFNANEYSILGFMKVSGAGVWTDGVTRFLMRIFVDVNNNTGINKNSVNNSIQFVQVAGGVTKQVLQGGQNSLGFLHLGLTVNKPANQLLAFIGGLQVGATQTGLGSWVGIPAAGNTIVGAGSTTPTFQMSGTMQHICVLNGVATKAEMAIAGVFP